MALNTMRMRYFAAIADLGSFSRAAEDLRVAQSALSVHMRALEEDLGTPLFTRTPRGVVLTEAGETLHSHIRSILRAVTLAEQATRDRGLHPSGDVGLGVINSLFPTLGIPVLRTCRERFPGIRLSVSEGDSRHLREGLSGQTLDLIVTLQTVAAPTAVPLFQEPLYVIGPAGYFGDDTALSLSEAMRLPMIVPPQGHAVRIELERHAAALGVELNFAWQIEGFAATKTAIREGFGFSVLARSAVLADTRAGRLSCARLKDETMTRRVVLDMATSHPPTRAMLEVRGLILDLAKTLGGEGHWTSLQEPDADDPVTVPRSGDFGAPERP